MVMIYTVTSASKETKVGKSFAREHPDDGKSEKERQIGRGERGGKD